MPRVQMTPMVRFALYFLRVYLVVLLTLLVVRFLQRGYPLAAKICGREKRSGLHLHHRR